MDIEIAKEKLKVIDIKVFLNGMTEHSNYIVDKADEINIAIETVLNELERLKKYENLEWQEFNELAVKDKIIDEMANKLVEAHGWFYSEFDNYTKEDFIKYFERKVEEDK